MKMKKELVYSTNGNSLLEEVTNPQKLHALMILISAWEKVNEKILREVLTDNVIFIDPECDIISGVGLVIKITEFLNGWVECDTDNYPLLKVYRFPYRNSKDIFFIEVYDSTAKELYYSFNVFFRGDKIAKMKFHYNAFKEEYRDTIIEAKKNFKNN